MIIDISEKRIIKVIKAIRKLDSMEFHELGEDGNKMSDLFGITSTLNDFAIDLSDEIDY